MEMEDRLPRGLPDVDADVVAIRGVDALDRGPRLVDGGKELGSLGPRRVKPSRDVARRDQERVAGADWEGVPEAIDE
jgi:hypothetical protein